MISVCIATYNGAEYLREQVESILSQLEEEDEIVVSDDSSTDTTIEILQSFGDRRIKIFKNPAKGFVRNFENALRQAQGDFIFLSDQDDVWLPNKVEVCMQILQNHIAVNHNSILVDSNKEPLGADFFSIHQSRGGFWQTLWRNSYSGCCMAFRRELLHYALPFPKNVASHDIWLGLLAEKHGQPVFHSEPLLYYRRHGGNASSTAEKSRLSLYQQLKYRAQMFLSSLSR